MLPLNSELSDDTGTVSERFRLHARLMKDGQQKVGVCRHLRQMNVLSPFYGPGSFPSQNHRQRGMVVLVAVAHAAAVQDEGMVQEIAIAVCGVLELLQEGREDAMVVGIQLGESIHIRANVGVMRQIVESVSDVGCRIRFVTELVRQHHC